MFDKLLNKKAKPLDYFEIPQKPYNWESKNLSKMNQKDVRQFCQDQQKFIGIVIKRFEDAKCQYTRLSEKCDEMIQKNQIINQQIARMTNQHQELTIKFANLSEVLQMCTTEKQNILKNECNFLQENGVQMEKSKKDLQNILKVYKTQFQLCKKIQVQNRTLKARLTNLEEQVGQLQQYNKSKGSITANSKKTTNTIEQHGTMETQNSHRSARKNNTNDFGTQTYRLEYSHLRDFYVQTQEITFDKHEIEETFKNQQSDEQQQLKQYKDSQKTREDQIQLQLRYRSEIESLKKSLQNLSSEMLVMAEALNQTQSEKQKNECLYKQSVCKLQQLTVELRRLIVLNKEYEEQLSESKIKMLQNQEKGYQKTNSNTYCFNQMKLNSPCPPPSSPDNTSKDQLHNHNQIKEQNESAKIESLKKVNSLEQQLNSLRKANRRISEQKQVIQMSNQEHIESLNQSFIKIASQCQSHKKENARLNQEIQKLKIEKQNLIVKSKTIEQTLNGYHQKFQLYQKQKTTFKEDIRKLENKIQLSKRQIDSYNHKIDSLRQENQCKQRKYESQLNQQRIKIESLKRNLHNVQNKYQQTKASLEKTYEQNMYKGAKIVTLEHKLKEYKGLIQLLKKQKVQMEQTFQEKWKSHTSNYGRPQEMTLQQNSYSEGAQSPKQHQQNDEDQKYNHQLVVKQKMIDLEDRNLQLMAQLQILQQKLAIISQQNSSHECTIRNLNQKKEIMMKQIQKFSKRNSLPLPNQPNLQKIQKKQQKQAIQNKKNREKRIAEKAIKGFQIQRKMLNQLYKDFVKHFADEINSNENVKQIEKNINTMINKTIDMKDIFQDYL